MAKHGYFNGAIASVIGSQVRFLQINKSWEYHQ
jgi:hypothetical protein